MKRSLFLGGIWLVASCFAVARAQNDGSPPPPPPSRAPHAWHGDGPSWMHLPATRAEALADVRARFAALDTNKDGVLSEDELRPHMPGHPDDRAMRDHLFAMMDKDGNGQISKAEFDAFHAARMHGDRPMHRDRPSLADGTPAPMDHRPRDMLARMIFRHADANHDGKVTLAEAESAALARFDKVDTNHDGVLSQAERDAARQQFASHMRERHDGGWPHHGDMPPPPVAPQG